ncbi:MAG: hypothetical protein IJE43_15330 [Alphaproteobacteria bacterium]|nr:hypothetical protein [Alphaproteobacteria bacterium]MBR5824122.1 hypothetical protein [Paludibacteraceae bacterium]
MNQQQEKFESLWSDFIALVKGKLLTTANKQTLSISLANLILTDAASSWGSDYEINGRWIKEIRMLDPKKAELILEVLLNDLKFSDVRIKGVLPDYCNYLIPTIGAFVGYAAGNYWDVSKLWQVVSTIAPAVLLYPAVKSYRENQQLSNNENLINQYIEQLAKYKNSIISILS